MELYLSFHHSPSWCGEGQLLTAVNHGSIQISVISVLFGHVLVADCWHSSVGTFKIHAVALYIVICEYRLDPWQCVSPSVDLRGTCCLHWQFCSYGVQIRRHDSVHDHPSYLCCPDALSLVDDPLTGKRVWFTESHIVLIIIFFTCFIYSFYS